VQFSSTAALPPSLFLADCIINIVESEFSIGTGTCSNSEDAIQKAKVFIDDLLRRESRAS
jgi:hypothetical protein